MYFDCIVIGGGASGMMAAITAAKNGLNTGIIEHSDRVGKKILQTGNGKCNITNTALQKDCYLCEDKDFVMDIIEQFNVSDTIDFFKCLGIYPKSKNGYIYPNSEQASSVLDVLRLELEHQKVSINTDIDIINIGKTDDLFKINTTKGQFTCKKLILATGSNAAPKSGSDGSGYKLAKALGHSIIKPLPALVQLKSDLNLCKMMSGVRSEGKVQLLVDDELVAADTGEVQYTDYGISGIPVFQISRFAVRAVDSNRKTEVVIDMLPLINESDLVNMLKSRISDDGYKTMEQFLTGLLNKKLVGAVLKRVNVNLNDIASNKVELLEKIASIIKTFVVPINGFNSFENAQVCSGGVNTSEISSKTMQSKIVNDLYFAGEVADVDGICGGYNLQWAWSSGYVAGMQASK